MPNQESLSGILAACLSVQEIAVNFCDLHTPLDDHDALVAADCCYFCHDVTLYNVRAKDDGLNVYGIATYKVSEDFSQKEMKLGELDECTGKEVELYANWTKHSNNTGVSCG